ncbi:unnamed protein product [Alternaria alternata]
MNATIKINGMKAMVTENLFMALHHLRPVDGYRILWIDAVCIDQGHDKEKGHQVQQMGDIYRTAERVIVWLGTGSQDSDVLMEFLGTLPLNAEVHSASQLVPRDLQVRYREPMEKLLDRPWFRRIWVIQEVAKAQRAIVVCGWKSVSTRVFTNAPSLLGLEPDLHAKAILDVMPGHLRARNWYNKQPTLHILLQNFHRSEATDKRDMIYALLGMSSSVHERSKLQVDYGKDLQELIRDTTSTLLFPGRTESPDLYYAGSYSSETAEYGHEGVVRLLFEQDGIDINAKDEDGVTPLWTAARWGQESVVRLLVEQDGIDINAKDKDGATPLWIAAEYGHESVVRLLVEQDGIDINAKDKDGATPLRIAAEYGHESVMRLLVEQDGIDINAKDKDGATPLRIAAEYGYEGIMRLLVEQDGIDINAKDKDGATPLRIAAEYGYEGIMRPLVK